MNLNPHDTELEFPECSNIVNVQRPPAKHHETNSCFTVTKALILGLQSSCQLTLLDTAHYDAINSNICGHQIKNKLLKFHATLIFQVIVDLFNFTGQR